MVKQKVFDSAISTGTYREFIDGIFTLTETQPSSYVCFANVHMVIEAHKDKAFNAVLNAADIATPDGKPISVFINHFKGLRQERVCGMDVFPDLLREAQARGKSVYLYGTTDDVLEAIARKVKQELPALDLCGYYSPPFRVLTANEKHDIIQRINDANPDLLFVALGCPKQEKWMAEHKGKINACMLGVGQAFLTYAGKEKRLPKWMRDLSLEWVYRLMVEPRRLWKRYLYTNSLFVWLTVRYKVNTLFNGKSAA